jgi:hypothetical protein
MNNRKLKSLIVVAFVLQIVALFLVLVNVPEPSAAIRIGLEELQTNAPAAAATFTKTAEGNWIIKTAGDYFWMANNWFGFIVKVTICSMFLNILFFVSFLFLLRKKKVVSTP